MIVYLILYFDKRFSHLKLVTIVYDFIFKWIYLQLDVFTPLTRIESINLKLWPIIIYFYKSCLRLYFFLFKFIDNNL